MTALATTAMAQSAATRPVEPVRWTFNKPDDMQGWTAGGHVKNIRAEADGLHFETFGADPLLVGPQFPAITATNGQVVVVEMECDRPVTGELYYTNKTEGRYGGFEPEWMTSVFIPSASAPGQVQSITIWPFWERLGTVNRLRFDPPTGATCRLVSIRIEDDSSQASPDYAWDFTKGDLGTWRPMYGLATPKPQAGKPLKLDAPEAQGLLLTAVRPFDAATRPLLRIRAQGEGDVAFYWVTRNGKGVLGTSVCLPTTTQPSAVTTEAVTDLRTRPAWRGTITHVGLGPSEQSTRVWQGSLEPASAASPLVARFFGFDRSIRRVGQDATVRLELENASAETVDGRAFDLTIRAVPPHGVPGQACLRSEPAAHAKGTHAVTCPRVLPGCRVTLEWPVRPSVAGPCVLTASAPGEGALAGQLRFEALARVEEPIAVRRTQRVPEPRPVHTAYDIGVYYFPGWAPDEPGGTSKRWKLQADFPERDPVLGWYREGEPEVADWHIKWAVENGIRFFIYDWYWRDGKIALQEGLHDGFLKARYRDRLKFCIMWANHPPFSNHSKEQFIQVADYWIEHYLRLPNYYRINGRPYVSFFHVGELQTCFKTDEKLREGFGAMRERIKAAGLGDPYIVVCGDAGRASQEWYGKVGFDAVTAYNYLTAGAATTQSPYAPFIRAHETIWRAARSEGIVPYIPLLTSNWDARPWHGQDTNVRFGRTTARFEAGLRQMRAFLDETGAKVGILEAWNEWGEGSYIEPNREFGFGDLEAIRRTFGRPGDWPANIGPDDVGFGPYDVRAVRADHDGPTFVPIGRRVYVYTRAAPGSGDFVPRSGTSVEFPALETRRISIDDYTVVAGAVQSWHGGNRLWIDPQKDRRILLNGSLVPGSVRIEPRDGGPPLAEGKDYTLDTRWAAFALTPGGRLRPGDRVKVSYEYSLRRVDALAIEKDGRPACIPGKPLADCPVPPNVPEGMLFKAHIYRPFNADIIEPHHVYTYEEAGAVLEPYDGPKPTRAIEKLRAGKPMTVVCWGDSVTACGDASTPERCYVKLFETGLREKYPKATIRVINAGIGGTSTPGRLPTFQKEVLDHKPDLVTLEFVNDMGLPADVLQKNYDEILRRATAAGAELILITPHFTMPEWMNLPHGRGPDSRPAVAFLRKFAEEHRVPLADAAARWEMLAEDAIPYETLLRNGINHPDDRGHALFAEELMRVMD